jgi:hypothetical protein
VKERMCLLLAIDARDASKCLGQLQQVYENDDDDVM